MTDEEIDKALDDGPSEEMPSGQTPTESETHDPAKGDSYVRFSKDVAWGYEDFRKFIRSRGQDPDEVTFTWGVTSNPTGGYWNKLLNVKPIAGTAASIPQWPLIQPGPEIKLSPTKITKTPRASTWKTAIVGSDTQFGFRFTDDGVEEFHDEDAISVFHQIVALENPDKTIIAGDILDLSAQGKFVQEAGFARSTQPAIDRATTFAAQLRQDTNGEIHFLEGNHDKRMQNFVEVNALSALGLRQGNWPESYPVMSIPFLLRLEEFGIDYYDAYPAAHVWINDQLRVEHGDRSNNNGSTAERYAKETPHISRVFGHSHRLEVIPRTTYDRQGRISSKFVNTGCLCKVDGTVPGYHSATGAGGKSALVWENWQHGFAVFRYRDNGEFFVNLVSIEDGVTVYEGQEIRA